MKTLVLFVSVLGMLVLSAHAADLPDSKLPGANPPVLQGKAGSSEEFPYCCSRHGTPCHARKCSNCKAFCEGTMRIMQPNLRQKPGQ